MPPEEVLMKCNRFSWSWRLSECPMYTNRNLHDMTRIFVNRHGFSYLSHTDTILYHIWCVECRKNTKTDTSVHRTSCHEGKLPEKWSRESSVHCHWEIDEQITDTRVHARVYISVCTCVCMHTCAHTDTQLFPNHASRNTLTKSGFSLVSFLLGGQPKPNCWLPEVKISPNCRLNLLMSSLSF